MIVAYNPKKSTHHFIIGALAAALLIPGGMLLFDGIYFGIIPVMMWFSLTTIKSGVKINEHTKGVKLFKEYLWVRFYNNFGLENYKSFRVKKRREVNSFSTRVNTLDVNKEYHTIELFNQNTQKFKSLVCGDKETIVVIADKLENNFGLIRMLKKQ